MRVAILSLVFVLGSGAGAWAQEGMTEKDLARLVAEELPAGFAVESVQIRAEENVGSKVMPVIVQRLVVETESTEDLFSELTEFFGEPIFDRTAPAGTQLTLYGLAQSTLEREEWVVAFDWENADELRELGTPVSALPEFAIILGSDEYRALETRVDEMRAQLEGVWTGTFDCAWNEDVPVTMEITAPPVGEWIDGVVSYRTPSGLDRAYDMTFQLSADGFLSGLSGMWLPGREPDPRALDSFAYSFNGRLEDGELVGSFCSEPVIFSKAKGSAP